MDLHADWNDLLKVEFFRVLLALLPGLITAAIVYSLTVKKSLTPVERVIEALLYTFLANFTWLITVGIVNFFLFIATFVRNWAGTIWHLAPIDWHWSPAPTTELIWLGAWGVIWGLVLTWIVNCGKVHDLLAWMKLTKSSSQPNQWYHAFYDSKKEFIVVHLKDSRRIYGQCWLYPDLPNEGHLVLEDAEWLPVSVEPEPTPLIKMWMWLPDSPPQPSPETPAIEKTNNSPQRQRIRIMIPASEVVFIEFVPIPQSGA